MPLHICKIMVWRLTAFMAIIIGSVIPMLAQGQYALLTHNGTTQVFSGVNALIEANDVAVDGDVITLSTGAFKSICLTKNLTIRGAGMNQDGNGTSLTKNSDLRDELGSQFAMIINPSNTGKVIIQDLELLAPEVIYGANSPTSVKVIGSSDVDIEKCNLIPRVEAYSGTLNIINCMIEQEVSIPDSYVESDKMPNMFGCIVLFGDVMNCNMTNCTIVNGCISGSGRVENCLSVGKNQGATASMKNCVIVSTHTEEDNYYERALKASEENSPTTKYLTSRDVFQQGDNTYRLLESNAAEWLGSDGTQVGAHGGQFPFNTLPSSPRIVKLDVANRTTTEGFLDVTISIE